MSPKIPLLALAFIGTNALAGNLGPGPWANGAYYPGQFDGVYTASVFGGASSVVSGILSFGVEGGAPNEVTNSTVLSNGVQNIIGIDPFKNYYVVFVDGRSYVGFSLGTLNTQSKSMAGALLTGSSEQSTALVATTNTATSSTAGGVVVDTNVTLTPLEIQNTCGGAYTAKITSDKAVIAFKGDNTGILATSTNGIPTATNTFSVSGMRVGS